MISTDYSKSEDMAKAEDMAKDIFKTVDNIVMRVKETRDEFIFSTLSKYTIDNFNIVVEKAELVQAIHLIRMCKEYGPGIDKRWSTATQQTAYLDDAYRRGFKDGVDKEHDRIMSVLERKENDYGKS